MTNLKLALLPALCFDAVIDRIRNANMNGFPNRELMVVVFFSDFFEKKKIDDDFGGNERRNYELSGSV